jgi:hypothetical protein
VKMTLSIFFEPEASGDGSAMATAR